ncbi:MAG: glycosyltransferase [Flavobacterium sp.]|nr:glycosyltransferase [Flavobacterium sp.]
MMDNPSELIATNIVVSVICHTYNHENFIREAIDGILLQKTNFDIEVIIHDDASTDKTREIIEDYHLKYPSLIKPIYQTENKFSQKLNISANFTYPVAKGKYIALCEGDDYWTDENKLQKQVDFLKQNTEYVICWTDFINKNGDTFIDTGFDTLFPEIYPLDFNNIFKTYNTFTLTTLFKKDSININAIFNFKHVKDNTLYSLSLANGKGAFLNFKSAVYRWHSGGIYSLKSSLFKNYSSYLNLKEVYDKIEPARTENIKEICNGLLKNAAFETIKIGKNDTINSKIKRKIIITYLLSVSFKHKIRFIKSYFMFKK